MALSVESSLPIQDTPSHTLPYKTRLPIKLWAGHFGIGDTLRYEVGGRTGPLQDTAGYEWSCEESAFWIESLSDVGGRA